MAWNLLSLDTETVPTVLRASNRSSISVWSQPSIGRWNEVLLGVGKFVTSRNAFWVKHLRSMINILPKGRFSIFREDIVTTCVEYFMSFANSLTDLSVVCPFQTTLDFLNATLHSRPRDRWYQARKSSYRITIDKEEIKFEEKQTSVAKEHISIIQSINWGLCFGPETKQGNYVIWEGLYGDLMPKSQGRINISRRK